MIRRVVLGAACVAIAASATSLSGQRTEVWSEPVYTEQQDPETMENPDVVERPGPFDTRLAGTWDLWVPGGIWYSTDGVSVFQNYTPGAAMNRLTIHADGSYEWAGTRGELVEIRPWFAEEGSGKRYYAVARSADARYMLTYSDYNAQLTLLFWGVGGHLADGTRLTPAPESESQTLDPRLTGEWRFPARGELSLRDRLAIRADGSYEWGSSDPMYTPMRGTLHPGAPSWGRPGVLYAAGLGGGIDRYYAAFIDGGVAILTEDGRVLGSTAPAGGAGVDPSAGPGERPGSSGATRFAGTAHNSGTTGTAVIELVPTSDGRVRATASFSGGLGGDATLKGSLQGERLELSGELLYQAARYAMVVTGSVSPRGALSATYSLTPTDRPGSKQGGTIQAHAADVAAPAPPSVGGSGPAGSSAGGPLGVTWAGGSEPTPVATPLARSWRYESLLVRAASGAVQDASSHVQGALTLGSDGRFTQTLRIGTREMQRAGTYRVEGETLLLDGGPSQSSALWFRLDGGRLLLQEEHAGTQIRYGLTAP